MKTTKINSYIFGDSFAYLSFPLQISTSLRLCVSILLLSFLANAQNLPDKIRRYKVYHAKISVKTENDKIEPKGVSEAFVKIGEPEIVEVSLTGFTLELSAEISGLEQSGHIDFLTFHDFRVNGLPVEIEEYKEPFTFKKNKPIQLPKPVKIFLSTTQTLRGALKELKNEKEEWQVTGRIFVFGKFKKFGFSFKRVVPVEINLKIKNPLKVNT